MVELLTGILALIFIGILGVSIIFWDTILISIVEYADKKNKEKKDKDKDKL